MYDICNWNGKVTEKYDIQLTLTITEKWQITESVTETEKNSIS